MLFNRFDSMEMIREKIEEITSEDLMETANEILAPEKLSMLVFK